MPPGSDDEIGNEDKIELEDIVADPDENVVPERNYVDPDENVVPGRNYVDPDDDKRIFHSPFSLKEGLMAALVTVAVFVALFAFASMGLGLALMPSLFVGEIVAAAVLGSMADAAIQRNLRREKAELQAENTFLQAELEQAKKDQKSRDLEKENSKQIQVEKQNQEKKDEQDKKDEQNRKDEQANNDKQIKANQEHPEQNETERVNVDVLSEGKQKSNEITPLIEDIPPTKQELHHNE